MNPIVIPSNNFAHSPNVQLYAQPQYQQQYPQSSTSIPYPIPNGRPIPIHAIPNKSPQVTITRAPAVQNTNNNNQQIVNTTNINGANNMNEHYWRTVRLDHDIHQSGQSMILGNISRRIQGYLFNAPVSPAGKKEIVANLNLSEMAAHISAMNDRMFKTLMEIIMDFNASNPDVVKIMGKKDGAPYGGQYNQSNNSTSFDLKKFPDALIIVLYDFLMLKQQSDQQEAKEKQDKEQKERQEKERKEKEQHVKISQ